MDGRSHRYCTGQVELIPGLSSGRQLIARGLRASKHRREGGNLRRSQKEVSTTIEGKEHGQSRETEGTVPIPTIHAGSSLKDTIFNNTIDTVLL